MVALPSMFPHSQRPQPGQPTDLSQRPPRDMPANPQPAPDPATSTISPATAPHALAQSEFLEMGENEAAGEDTVDTADTSAYSPLLKDHVFALYCAGQRSPAIAAELGIPERTARHWVHMTLQQLAQDDVTASPAIARQQRALAIESQRAALASAWETYHRLTAAHNQLLDLALMTTLRQSHPGADGDDAPQADIAAVIVDPQRLFANVQRLASSAARYLALVISANREIALLQGQAVVHDARERHAVAARDAANARQVEADLIRAFTTPKLPPEPALPHLSPYNPWPGDGIPSTHTLPTDTDALLAALHANFRDDTTAGAHPSAGHPSSQTPVPAKTAMATTPLVTPISPAQRATLPTSAAKTATPLAAVQAASRPELTGAAKTAMSSAPRVSQSTGRPQSSPELRDGKMSMPRATPRPPQPRRPANARNKPQLILPPKP